MKSFFSVLALAAMVSCTQSSSTSLSGKLNSESTEASVISTPDSEQTQMASNEETEPQASSIAQESIPVKSSRENAPAKVRRFVGSFSNGMKGAKFSFEISEDGQRMENVIYQGYWYCGSKLESTTAGPDGHFTIQDNKVEEFIVEPPDGGSTAWRFDMTAEIKGNTASGTFRMNINNLGCNTGMLNWTATEED